MAKNANWRQPSPFIVQVVFQPHGTASEAMESDANSRKKVMQQSWRELQQSLKSNKKSQWDLTKLHRTSHYVAN